MFDLDNLDLELDDDFPSGPLIKTNSLETKLFRPLAWAGNKNQENNIGTKCDKPIKPKNLEHFSNGSVDSELTEKKKNGEQGTNRNSATDLTSSDIFNHSFSPTKFLSVSQNNLNTSVKSTPTKRILTQRKFPGPAGLLPDKPLRDLSDLNIIVDSSFENVTSERQKKSVILCSQTLSITSEDSYKKLTSDFNLNDDNCPLNKYTIDWVKKRALKKTLGGQKVPFLAVIVHHLDHSTPDPVLTLRDSTGEMYGTLHREVWADFGEKLHPGASLALRQVGVLITGITRRQVYLNITLNNIINVYSYSADEEVETNCINEFKKSDLLETVCERQNSGTSRANNSPCYPFTVLNKNKFNCSATSSKAVSYIKKSEFSEGNSLNSQTKKLQKSHSETSNTESTTKSNSINFLSSMDDDISEFLASLDENSGNFFVKEELFGQRLKDENVSRIRKRKMDFDDDLVLDKSGSNLEKKMPDKDTCAPPIRKVECQERFILGSQSQPLSQAESQIVEEVLDGINLDDFDS